MGCGGSTKKIRHRIEQQNEAIARMVAMNNDLKSQLTSLQNQERLMSKHAEQREKKVIDLTQMACEIELKFRELETMLNQLDSVSSGKREELIKKVEELNEWKTLLDQVNEVQEGNDVSKSKLNISKVVDLKKSAKRPTAKKNSKAKPSS